MNIQGGGISFEISGTNDKLLRILDQSKASMQKFSGEVKKGGNNIDTSFNAITSAIGRARADLDKTDITWTKTYNSMIQKLNDLKAARDRAWVSGDDSGFAQRQSEIKTLENQIAKWEKLGQTIRGAYSELDGQEAKIRSQYNEATKVANAQASIRAQLRKAKEELMQMEQSGKRGTKEYEKQRDEVVRLTAAMKGANKQATNLANPTKNFQAVIGGLTLMTSSYQAVTGAMGLFAGENANLQRIMTKVQSVMSITMALQTAYTQLNKNSEFQLVLVAKAKDALTAANTRLATALGISTAAAQALIGTLTLGLSVALTAIIVILSKFQSKAAEARKEQEEFNKKASEAAAEPLEAYSALQAGYLKLTGSMKDREKWVQDNSDKFADLGVSIRSAKEAEDFLIKNTDAFVNACVAKAKAAAMQEKITEKYREIVKKQLEYEKMSDTKTTYVQTSNFGTGKYVTGRNTEKDKAKTEIDNLKESVRKLVDEQLKFSEEEKNYRAKLGESAQKTISGSVEAAEAEVSRLKSLYNRAGTDAERAAASEKLKAAEDKLAKIQYNSSNSTKSGANGNKSGKGNDKAKDAYAEELAEKKKLYSEYTKWVQSEDATVREAAGKHFASLLEQGTSYVDYLTRQRTELESKAEKTSKDLHKISLLNKAIAENTKQTVLSDFSKQLEKDLTECKTIGEMLDVIENRKEQLSNDGSETDKGKSEILTAATKKVTEKAKEETKAYLQEYASYQNEKVLFDESYARKKELLAKQSEQAATEAERQVALSALEALEQKRAEYEQRSTSERYDELKKQYKTYEQELNEIRKQYQEERNEAEKQGDAEMLDKIDKMEQDALSKLAAKKLMASASWTQLFSDLSTLSNKTISRLMAEINAQKVTFSAQFNPADLQAINTQLQKAKDELHKRNPFLALRDSLKELRKAMNQEKLFDGNDPFIQELEKKKDEYQKYTEAVNSGDETLAAAAKQAFADMLSEGSTYIEMLRKRIASLQNKKITIGLSVDEEGTLEKLEAAYGKETGTTKSIKEGLKEAFSSVSSSISTVKGAFDSVTSGMKKMGITMDEETETVVNDLSSMMGSASQIATGNPLSIIQGSVGFLSSAFDLFNSRDRKAEKSIKNHQKAVNRLGKAYNALQHEVDRALGESEYQNQSAMIRNLQAQQAEVQAMIDAEKSKKHTDKERIEEWEEQIASAGREIDNIMDEITQNLTQTDAASLASELGDALVDAFTDGTSAAKAFDEVAGDVLRNAVLNALQTKMLEEPLQNAIKQLQKDMGFDEEGNGTFDGLTEKEQQRFRDAVNKAGEQFQEAFKVYEDLFNELNENDPSTLSGAIKGASQESIDLLAGQTNAVRVNQSTSIALLRDQLQRLSNIDANVGVIAGRMLTIIDRLEARESDSLRGQGITY